MSEHQAEQSQAAAHVESGKSGLVVFVILAVMTIVEYLIATHMDAQDPKMVLLIVIAFVKAALILWYFMHVAKAWLTGGGSH